MDHIIPQKRRHCHVIESYNLYSFAKIFKYCNLIWLNLVCCSLSRRETKFDKWCFDSQVSFFFFFFWEEAFSWCIFNSVFCQSWTRNGVYIQWQHSIYQSFNLSVSQFSISQFLEITKKNIWINVWEIEKFQKLTKRR